jgi:hypothetical protein
VIQYVNFVIVAEGDFEFSFFNTRDQSMVPAGNSWHPPDDMYIRNVFALSSRELNRPSPDKVLYVQREATNYIRPSRRVMVPLISTPSSTPGSAAAPTTPQALPDIHDEGVDCYLCQDRGIQATLLHVLSCTRHKICRPCRDESIRVRGFVRCDICSQGATEVD